MTASASCLRLLTHCDRRAASRAACTAGNKSAIKTAMIAITTSSSISVNPDLFCLSIDRPPIQLNRHNQIPCWQKTSVNDSADCDSDSDICDLTVAIRLDWQLTVKQRNLYVAA